MTAASIKRGLGPLECPGARILILGSLPGDESIRQQQYYAHPQNQFWRIVAEVFNAPTCARYDERLALIAHHRLAVWDVLKSAVREGSLDTAIKEPIANAFRPFLQRHTSLEAIAFNGQKSAALFKRHVQFDVDDLITGLKLDVLPSTSPAAASINFDQKVENWRRVLRLSGSTSASRR